MAGVRTSLDLTDDLKALVSLAAEDSPVEDTLRRGLVALARVVDFDLAVVFILEDGKLIPKATYGALADARVKSMTLDLKRFPSIQVALDSRRARAFLETDHAHGDGDPFDGVLDLPHGHSCMVAPLCAGDLSFGVVTLDRNRCESYPQPTVELVEVYCQILGLAIQNAQQRETLARLHIGERERAKLLERNASGASGNAGEQLERSRVAAVRDLARRARQVAETDTPVLLLGETGTGKERLAHALHSWSRRRDRPFVAINCAAIPAGLLESELFGHVKGAFTGAGRDRPGRFQMANGGTLFLDEIGEMPMELQAKLLRAVQEGRFEPVGSDRSVKVDVRILAATHVDLEAAIKGRTFREDLFYRLSVFPLCLPPLRERLDDLETLAESIVAEQATRTGRRGVRLSAAALARLRAYAWPGNLRELANAIERATILSSGRGATLGPELFELGRPTGVGESRGAPARAAEGATFAPFSMDEAQRAHITHVLAACDGRIYGESGAALALGMKPSTLQSRMKRLGLSRTGAPSKRER